MKLFTAFFLLTFFLCFIGCSDTKADTNSHDLCKGLAETSKKIMTYRQAGRPMSDLMEAILPIAEQHPAGKELFKEIILKAYDHPLYSTESIKQEVIIEFENKIYKECIEVQ